MTSQPPPGQGPIDPRGAFSPPPPPPPPGWQPQQQQHVPPPHQMPPMPPTPPMYPPMYPPMFMPPPPRRGGGFVRGILVTLATTIFGLSLTLNLYLLIAHGLFSGGSTARSSNLLEGDPSQKVAVVPIKGTIMDDASQRFARLIKQIENDSTIKALVIEVDSPGGSVTASDEIFHRIQRFKLDHPKMPIVVSMGGLAASGGYYVSCAGDYLFAQPSTLTGNIGVLLPQFNVAELFDKWGIKENTIVSTGAVYKNAGSMFRPEDPKDRAYLQDIADKAFAQFKAVVKQGRSGHAKFDVKKLDEVANGKIYMTEDAVALGLVDEKGYLHDACEYAATKAGLSKPTVIRFQNPQSLLEALLDGKSNVGGTSASGGQTITVNGINITAADLRDLLTPRLMYLWRGQ